MSSGCQVSYHELTTSGSLSSRYLAAAIKYPASFHRLPELANPVADAAFQELDGFESRD